MRDAASVAESGGYALVEQRRGPRVSLPRDRQQVWRTDRSRVAVGLARAVVGPPPRTYTVPMRIVFATLGTPFASRANSIQ
ncbi:hypothetical protein OHA21_12905 [Actinoplanes sp. NBC_00393]|uniref:hypothetical protein n=1 Tax=Actinoplanes sp. NBC_00393 TaxID=2975953 RepID=UPI002E2439A0